MWHHAGGGRGDQGHGRSSPTRIVSSLFSKLPPATRHGIPRQGDSISKATPCNQGIAVYGNKGSTDQHAYVQQLREGVANFFVTFVQVLRDRKGPGIEVEEGVDSGDYLNGFLLGTRQALYEAGRPS